MNITPEEMIATIARIEKTDLAGSAAIAPLTAIRAAYPEERPQVIAGILQDMMDCDRSIRRSDFAVGLTVRDEDFQIGYTLLKR